MKDKILKIVGSSHIPLSRQALEQALDLKSSADFIAFDKAMDELEEDAELIRTRKNEYQTREQSGLIEGTLHVNRRGLGFIDREGMNSIVIQAKDQKDALDGDTVLVRTWDETGGIVEHTLKHAKDHFIGTFMGTSRGMRCMLDDEKLRNHLVTIRVPHDFKAVPGMKVLLKVEEYGSPLRLAVEQIIGHKDDPGVDISSVLLDHDIPLEFPQEVLNAAQAVPQAVTEAELQGRTDLRGVVTITVDGDDSKDFDDAVSITALEQGWQLKVSIADVSHYVTEGSVLDQEALRRGMSTYVTDRVVPMLPHVLSNGICSLNPQEDRLTLTCDMTIRPDGTVQQYAVYPSVINSNERMTYNNFNKILDGDPDTCAAYAYLGSLFTDLTACAEKIRAARRSKGAIDFDTDEAEIIVNEKGHPVDIRKRVRGRAERMIEDCMIAANVCVADYMNTHHIPCLYRIHDEPKARKLEQFRRTAFRLGHPFVIPAGESITPKRIQDYLTSIQDSAEYPILASQLLRCMAKAVYDPKCLGHFGIAEEEYLHFTSPIRRYPDLVVHRMLRKYAFEGCDSAREKEADQTRMTELAQQCNSRELLTTDAEFEVDDMKKAEYMADHLGEVADGLISGVTGFGFYVQLENTCEGLVHIASLANDYYTYDEEEGCLVGSRTHRTFRVGEKVKIKVTGASKENRSVDFTLASQNVPDRPSRPYAPNRSNTHGGRSGKMRSRGSHGRKY